MLLAASCFKCDEYEMSMKYYKEANDLNPYCAEALNGIGILYNKNSEFEKANECFYEAVNKNNDYMNAWINYANGLASMEENREKAKPIYNIILNYLPELYQVRNNYGKLLLSLNETVKAKEQFKCCKRFFNACPDIWNNLGIAYYRTQKMNKAIFHFEKSLELNSTCVDTWINLGRTFIALKYYEKAVDIFNKVLQLSPDNIIVLKNLAYIYFNLSNKSLTIKMYDKCLEIEPNNSELHLKLGLMKIDDYKEDSIEHLKKCIELNPQNEQPYHYLATAYRSQGENKYASEVMMSLGDMQFNHNNLKKAVHAYMYALKLNPKTADIYWKLGLSAYELGHLTLALSR